MNFAKKRAMKFERVDFEREIKNINEDGHPFMRKCAHHEILLSFFDDYGREEFENFWQEKGAELFADYMVSKGYDENFIKK